MSPVSVLNNVSSLLINPTIVRASKAPALARIGQPKMSLASKGKPSGQARKKGKETKKWLTVISAAKNVAAYSSQLLSGRER